MNEAEVLKDMNESRNYVMEKIKPIVEKILPGWNLIQVEGNTNEVCKFLDISCGIDYLLRNDNNGFTYGVASRVQYGVNYRTVTVRKERESGVLTEFQKRNQAISIGAIYPQYSMQAYIVDENVSGLAIVKTIDLMNFIEKGFAETRRTNMDKIGQAEFYTCEWDKIKVCGYRVLEYGVGDKN